MYTNTTWIEIPQERLHLYGVPQDVASNPKNRFWMYLNKATSKLYPDPPMISAVMSEVLPGLAHLVFKTIPASSLDPLDNNPLQEATSEYLSLNRKEAIDTIDILNQVAVSIPEIAPRKRRFYRLSDIEKLADRGVHLFPPETEAFLALLYRLIDTQALEKFGVRLFAAQTSTLYLLDDKDPSAPSTHNFYQIFELSPLRDAIHISGWHLPIDKVDSSGERLDDERPGLYLTRDAVIELRDMLLQAVLQMRR
jgi:hypothetical protein